MGPSGQLSIEVATALDKLARCLDVDRSEVEFLAGVGVAELRELRGRIDDRFASASGDRLAGVIAASKLVPTALAATIGEKWFGAVLCARLVGLVDSKRGAQYARHLSVDFMADITARTDPRVVGDLVHELDPAIMRLIAVALMTRDDHLTLSHFVGHIPAEVVADILGALADNAAVVRIARFVEDLDELDPIVALLPDERIVALVQAVAAEDLWVDGLHLFSHLGDEQITRIALTIVHQHPAALRTALEAFDRHDLWAQGLQLVEHLDETDIVQFSDELLLLDEDVVLSAIDVIHREDAWGVLVRIALAADHLGEDVRDRLRAVVDRLPDTHVDAFTEAARRRGHPDLLDTVLGR